MAIKIASWNIEGRLSGYATKGRGTAEHILEGIKKLDADILVLPEFHMDDLSVDAETRVKALGYSIAKISYEDTAREHEKWGPGSIGILSRLPLDHVSYIRPGDVRNLIVCEVTDPQSGKALRIIAAHLDDRSEARRLKQVRELVKIINSKQMPTIMLGDFNAMWRKGRARLLSSPMIRKLAAHIPHEELRSVATRVTDMATGMALQELTAHTNLRDADPRLRPTTTPKMRDISYMPSIRLIQIDHMLVSPEVSVRNFTIGKDGGSDHRSISATLDIL